MKFHPSYNLITSLSVIVVVSVARLKIKECSPQSFKLYNVASNFLLSVISGIKKKKICNNCLSIYLNIFYTECILEIKTNSEFIKIAEI